MSGRRFLFLFCGSALALAGALAVLLVLLDPFDRGHGLFAKRGTLEGGPRTANVSRGRDPDFNAAVIGNSHVQLLMPERLDAATGLRWVQLTVPATLAPEQLAMLRWFVDHHRGMAKALIIGTDYHWCHADPERALLRPFPFWLYDPAPLTYFGNLFRMQAARLLPRKIAYLAGLTQARRADGYWDYEAYRTHDETYLRRNIEQLRASTFWNDTGRFPWIDRLGEALARLAPELKVVLLAPPVHPDALPAAGSSQAAAERACIAALERIAAARPGTAVLDVRKESGRFADPRFFWDATHYSKPVAEQIEREAGQLIRTMIAGQKP